jgi:hypothetical protein
VKNLKNSNVAKYGTSSTMKKLYWCIVEGGEAEVGDLGFNRHSATKKLNH